MLLQQLCKKIFTPTLLGVVTFLLYLHHISASVYGGDSGDFLSAIAVRGVAHPSGYPLYTILGIFISLLPIHQTLAWKVDLISAFFAASAVVVMYAVSYELVRSKLIALCTALTLAFLYPFWLFAEVSEVFTLHNFFVLLLFYLGIMLYKTNKRKYGYALAFFFGLSLTNHELIILLIPSLVVFLIAVRKSLSINTAFLFKCLGLSVLGLLPYLYIPLAAFRNPPINWDHATTIANFFFLITRGDYTWGKIVSSTKLSVHLLALQDYYNYLTAEFPLLLLISIPIGAVAMLWRKQFIFFAAIFLNFFVFGPVFFFYGYGVAPDIFSKGIEEKFYTTSLLFLIMFLPYTIAVCSTLWVKLLSAVSPNAGERPLYPVLFSCVFFIIPYVLFVKNVSLTDVHTITLGDKLGYDILTTLPKNSYLIVKGDDMSFNTLYMHFGQHIRPDISIPPTDVLTKVVSSQIHKHPQSLAMINPHDPAVSTLALLTVYSSAVHSPSIFATINNYSQLIQQGETNLMPYGVVEKLATPQEQAMDKDTFIKQQQNIFTTLERSPYQMPPAQSIARDWLIAEIPEYYAAAYTNTGYYLMVHYHDNSDAKIYFTKALSIYPDTAIAYEGLGDYYVNTLQCKQAKDAYTKATQIDFLNTHLYGKLYHVVKDCLHDRKTTNELKTFFQHYPTIFGNIIKPNIPHKSRGV